MTRSKKAKPKATPELMKNAAMGASLTDSFQNLLNRTGAGSPSMMEATRYPITRLTKDYNLMNSLYRNSWIARRIVSLVPRDMLKNWIKWDSDITPEQIDQLQADIRTTQLKKQLYRGLCFGRLYGGAGGLMLIDGQDDLSQPLDLESIMPGDFKGLLVMDRWSGCVPNAQLIDDISSPEYGLPESYQFTIQAPNETVNVHHSRMIRFNGLDLPIWETQAEQYWGSSIIENIYEELRKRDNTSANIAGLIFMANLRILKIADLGEMLASAPTSVQSDFYNTIQAQNTLMNNFGVQVMGSEDDFQQFQLNNFNGLNDIYESFMLDVAGACEIPVTRLFGRSPAGFNSGENDMRSYYEMIESNQEDQLRPVIEKIMPVLAMSTFGQMPDDLDFAFNPIETPSDKDIGETVRWKTDSIYNAHDRGLLTDQLAMKELKQLSEGTGIFSNISPEDINNASNEIVKPELLSPFESGDNEGGEVEELP
jgi:phage-related protein (TIGR01555 family)